MRRSAAPVVIVFFWLTAVRLLHSAPDWELTVNAPIALAATAGRIERIDAGRLGADLIRAGLELPERVHVTLIPEGDPRATQTPGWFVGVAFGTNEIVIFPERVSSYPYDSIESVLRHEVVHLALEERSGGRPLPRWFHEGTAVSVESGWRMTDQLRLLVATATEPAVDDVARLFQSQTQPQTTQAYLLAAALMDELRRRHGPALPGRIAEHVARDVSFDRAFELQTGATPNQAARDAWQSYQRWTSWVPAATSPSSTWSLILVLAFLAFFVRIWQRARRRRQWDDDED